MYIPNLSVRKYLPSYCSIVNDKRNSIYYFLLFAPKYQQCRKKSDDLLSNITFDGFFKRKIETYNVEASNEIFSKFLSKLFSKYNLYVKIKKYNTTAANEIIYIESLEELSSKVNSNNTILHYLDNTLNKYKIPAVKIYITDIDDSSINKHTKEISIGGYTTTNVDYNINYKIKDKYIKIFANIIKYYANISDSDNNINELLRKCNTINPKYTAYLKPYYTANKNIRLHNYIGKIISSDYRIFTKILFTANSRKNKISSLYYNNIINPAAKVAEIKYFTLIMKILIKNFKISMRFKEYNNIEDLLKITSSDKIFFCFLHDVLLKLRLNTEITITANIKIGYIDDKSKAYNKDLKVYTDNAVKLAYIIVVLMFYPNDYSSCHSIQKKLSDFFINL